MSKYLDNRESECPCDTETIVTKIAVTGDTDLFRSSPELRAESSDSCPLGRCRRHNYETKKAVERLRWKCNFEKICISIFYSMKIDLQIVLLNIGGSFQMLGAASEKTRLARCMDHSSVMKPYRFGSDCLQRGAWTSQLLPPGVPSVMSSVIVLVKIWQSGRLHQTG